MIIVTCPARPGARLGWQPQRIHDERDRVVPAAEQKQVDRGVLANRVQQRPPLGVVEVGALVQSVYGREDGTACRVSPVGVCWVPVASARGAERGEGGVLALDLSPRITRSYAR